MSVGLIGIVALSSSGNAASGETSVIKPEQASVYAFVGEKPVHVTEVAERINELPALQRQQLTTQPAALKAYIDNVLVDRLITDAAMGLELEATEAYERKLRLARERILRELYIDKLSGQVPQPTEAELNSYYRLNLANFTRPASIRMKFVLVGDLAAANRIYREAKGGADFDALQATWSMTTDSVTALQIDNLPPEVHGQISNLTSDGIFMPYSTAKGVYIFKKLSTTPLQILPLDEVRDAVRQAAHREKVQSFLAAFVETLKRDHPIRVVGSIQQNATHSMEENRQ